MKTLRKAGVGLLLLAAWFPSHQVVLCDTVQAPARTSPAGENPAGWLRSKIGDLQTEARRRTAETAATPGTSDETLGWTFHDMDAAEALQRLEEFGLKVPVEAAGRLTLRLRVGVPWRSLLSTKDYRLYAWLDSKQLTIEGIEARDVSAQMSYVDGVLRLERFRFSAPAFALKGREGRVSGNATLQLEPLGDLVAQLDLNRLGLEHLVDAWLSSSAGKLPGQEGIGKNSVLVAGGLTGRLASRVPFQRWRERSAWRADGAIRLSDLRVEGLPSAEWNADVRLAGGRLTFRQLTGEADFFQLDGAGRLDVSAPFHYTANLRLTSRRLARLNELRAAHALPVEIGGRLGASLAVEGDAASRSFSARGAVTARDLRIAGNVFDAVDFRYEADQRELRLRSVELAVAGGRVLASADVPLTGDAESRANLRWNRLPLTALLQSRLDLGAAWRALATGDAQLRAPRARLGDLAAWTVDGATELDEVAWGGLGGGRARADLRLAGGSLDVRKFSIVFDRSRIDGSLKCGVAAPFDFTLSLDRADVDLSEAARLPAGILPPWRLEGAVHATASLTGTLRPRHVTGRGALSAADIHAAGLELNELRTDFDVQKERVNLTGFEAAAYGGRLRGSASLPLAAGVAAEADVAGERLALGTLVEHLGTNLADATAQASGRATLKTGGDPRDPALWQGDLTLNVNDISALGDLARQGELQAKLKDGWLELSRVSIEGKPGDRAAPRLVASGRMKVVEPYDFRVQFDLASFVLDHLRSLPPNVRPTVELQGVVNALGEAHGTADPGRISAAGEIHGSRLNLAGAKIDLADIRVALNERRLQISDFKAEMYEGAVSAAAVMPLTANDAGNLRCELRTLDVGRLLADVARLPVEVRGKIDGNLRAEIPPGAFKHPAEWDLHGRLDAPGIVVNSLLLGKIRARLDHAGDALEYEVDGEVLNGPFTLAGAWTPPDDKPSTATNQGHLRIEGARFDELGRVLRELDVVDVLSGTVDASLDYRHDIATGWPVGAGQFAVRDVGLDGVELVEGLGGTVKLAPRQVAIEDLQGSIADGVVEGHGNLSFDDGQRGMIRLSLLEADAGRLLTFWPELAAVVRGTVNVSLVALTGLDRPWRFEGAASLRKATWLYVPLTDVRLPFDGSFDPASGNAELRLRDGTAQVALGHATTHMTLSTRSGLQLNGRGNFADVNLHHLLQHSPGASHVGDGRMSGEFTVAGRNLDSLKDLTGTIKARLQGAKAGNSPVVKMVQGVATGALIGATRFDDGDLRATLARGVMRVERLSLASSRIQVYAHGTLSLDERLRLGVMLSTAQSNTSARRSLLASRLSSAAAPGTGLLADANQFLANQVIYLDVGGTLHSPTVRIKPLPVLGEEAVRFLLLLAVP